MKATFKSSHTIRCMFCYTSFDAEISLTNHLNDGVCYDGRKHVTRTVLKENEVIPHRDLISEICPELMLVADCEAMLSKDSGIQNADDDDDDIDFF